MTVDLSLPGIDARPLPHGPRNSGQSPVDMAGNSNIKSNINQLFLKIKNIFYCQDIQKLD
jgi:hypothetical protein